MRDGWPKPNPAAASYDNLEKGEVTVVDLSPDGGVPDGAAEPGWCLFSGSAAVAVLSFPKQERSLQVKNLLLSG